MQMPGRTFAQDDYRYGFNGMEADDELKGEGNSIDFGARMYDSRIARWMSTDPMSGKYASWSPYNFSMNSPLAFVDPDGEDPINIIISSIKSRMEIGYDQALTVQGSLTLKVQLYDASNDNLNMTQLRKDFIKGWKDAWLNDDGQVIGAIYGKETRYDLTEGTLLPNGEIDEVMIHAIFNVNLEVEIINNLDEVDGDATVIVYSDKEIKGDNSRTGGDEGGAHFGNSVAIVETRYFGEKKKSYERILSTTIHELGHDQSLGDLYTKENPNSAFLMGAFGSNLVTDGEKGLFLFDIVQQYAVQRFHGGDTSKTTRTQSDEERKKEVENTMSKELLQ